jgi:hypothetical protein
MDKRMMQVTGRIIALVAPIGTAAVTTSAMAQGTMGQSALHQAFRL